MKGIGKEFSETYEKIERAFQSAGSGHIFPTEEPECYSLFLNFSSKTLECLTLGHSFSRLYQIYTKDSLKVFEPLPRSFENPVDLKVKSISPSGKLEVRVRKPTINGKETLMIEVWENGYLRKTKDISKTLKFLYNDSMFGGICWSQDESLIAFVAEPADKTYNGIWEEIKEKEGEENKESVDPLDKYVYKEDFGDQMADKANPRLYIFDVKNFGLEEVIQAGEKTECWPGSPLFLTGNELLFHGYKKKNYKEGLIYCLNRPSALYFVKDCKSKDALLEKITDEYMVFAPSVSPDYKKIAYLTVEKEFIEHSRCLELRIIDWPKKSAPQVIIPVIMDPKIPEFPGIYGSHDAFNFHGCGFLKDGIHYIFPSMTYAHSCIYIVNIETKKIVALNNSEYETESQGILVFKDDLIILQQSSVKIPPYNVAIKFDFENSKGDTETLIKSSKWCKFGETKKENAPEIFSMLEKVTKKHIKIDTAEGYLYYPETSNKKGLITIIHGGPHSSYVNQFYYELTGYLASGYAVMGVNYRGSLGYGQSYVESLMGHIGDYDVTDCIDCVEAACKEVKDVVDVDNLFVTGGSHGGYLTTWLIARYPKRFNAAIVRNPVVDVSFMTSASDIPEWGFSEVLKAKALYPPEEESRKKLWEQSPLSQVSKIETPFLIMLGGKDKRVPMLNTIPLYNFLRSNGKEIKFLYFPNDSHPLGEPETRVHSSLAGLIWLEEHRKHN